MSFGEQAAFLREKSNFIIKDWEQRVRAEMPRADELSRSALRDHVPILLEELALTLEGGSKERAAREHGRHRAAQDFDVRDALRDLSILRETTIDCFEGTNTGKAFGVTVHRFFDRAMQDAAGAVWQSTMSTLRAENEVRDKILSTLSHDLRNPLSAVCVGTELILADSTLRPTTRRAAERVGGSAARMTRMIRDLLDFGRSTHAGVMHVERQPCDLSAIAHEIVDELRTAHPKRSIELVADGAIDGAWDRDRLAQMFSNLIGNALQYGLPDEPVTVQLDVKDRRVTVEVRDRGRVISESDRKKIFEPFQRGEDHRRGGDGLGLGLYIVREIVRAHGGDVAVTRSDPELTVFTVHLPLEASHG